MTGDELRATVRDIAAVLREAGVPHARLLPTGEVVRYTLPEMVRALAQRAGRPQGALLPTSTVDVVATYERGGEVLCGSVPMREAQWFAFGGPAESPLMRRVYAVLLGADQGHGDLMGVRLQAHPSPRFHAGARVQTVGRRDDGSRAVGEVTGRAYTLDGWTYSVRLPPFGEDTPGTVAHPVSFAEAELQPAGEP